MARDNYRYTRIAPVRGINTNVDLAGPGEVLVGSNVWAPRGKCVRRPGYLSWSFPLAITATIDAPALADETTAGVVTLQPAGVLALSVTALSKWYIKVANPVGICGVQVGINTDNAAAAVRRLEYWNGTEWAYLPSIYSGSAAYLNDDTAVVRELFVPPPDWATTSVGGSSGYWVRTTLLSAITAGTALATATSGYLTTAEYEFDNARIVEFPFGQFMVYSASATNRSTNSSIFGIGAPVPPLFPQYPETASASRIFQNEISTFAVVPTFREVYAAGSYNTIRFTYTAGAWAAAEATVEDASSLVGTRGLYSSIARLPDFPRGEFIEFFKDRIWIVSRDGNVWWSMGGLGYRVFPAIATTAVVEDDDSPVTGIAGFGEQLVIFKRNSIWIMVDNGIDPFGVTQFSAVKVASGVGCAAHKTIQKIRGNLIFLGSDGLYSFDGSPIVRKVTHDTNTTADRLAGVFSRVSPGREHRAAAGEWKENSCYLLAISLDGADKNSHIIVWDYERDAFWLWDISADAIFVLQDNKDTSTMFFASTGPVISKLHNCGEDYYTPVDVTVQTHPIGYVDPSRKMLRSIEVMASSRCGDISLDIDVDEDESIQSGSINFDSPVDTGKAVQRTRNLRLRALGGSFKAKLSKTTSQVEQFDVKYIDIGVMPQGRR